MRLLFHARINAPWKQRDLGYSFTDNRASTAWLSPQRATKKRHAYAPWILHERSAVPFGGVGPIKATISQFRQGKFFSKHHKSAFFLLFALLRLTMKLAGIFTLLLAAVLTPLVSARLTLLRLASLDQPSKLRGLAPRPEPSAYEANLYVDGYEFIAHSCDCLVFLRI